MQQASHAKARRRSRVCPDSNSQAVGTWRSALADAPRFFAPPFFPHTYTTFLLSIPSADASRRLLEVVNLLRKRPSLKQTGLLWKLQASLHDAVEEQERLKG